MPHETRRTRVRTGHLPIVAILACCACDGPASPSRPGTLRPAPAIFGVVRDGDGRELPGVRVIADSGVGRPETTSSERGEYRLPIGGPAVRLEYERPGFEPAWVNVSNYAASELRRDLRLHPVTRVGVGESVYASVDSDDQQCVVDAIEAMPCRRLRVVSQKAVAVRVYASDEENGAASVQVFLQSPGGASAAPGDFLELHLEAGREVVLEVVARRYPGGSATIVISPVAR